MPRHWNVTQQLDMPHMALARPRPRRTADAQPLLLQNAGFHTFAVHWLSGLLTDSMA